MYIGNIHAGKALHARLINNVLASPMMFFDTTPIGRILNRFSKDIDVIDTQIGRTYESWLSCLLRVISVPIVIGYSTPYFLIVFIPLAVLYIAVQVNIINFVWGGSSHACSSEYFQSSVLHLFVLFQTFHI